MHENIELIKGLLLIMMILCTGIIAVGVISRWQDKRDWNKGYCKCGNKWRLDRLIHDDTQHHTSPHYVCDKCHNECTIIYDSDLPKKK